MNSTDITPAKVFALVSIQLLLIALVLLGPLVDLTVFKLPVTPIRFPLSIICLTLILTGCLIIAIAFGFLGRSLTANPIPKPEGALVTSGIYGLCRHPVYLGLFLLTYGWTFYLGSYTSGGATIALTGLLHFKARLEEKMLLRKYGADYENYTLRVGRFFPLRFRK